MFAFALWDSQNDTLFLARDRLGIKPLYYYQDKDGIYFASEIKAFLENPNFYAEADWQSITSYLSFRYVPVPHTLFNGIKKLDPGYYILYQHNYVNKNKYWDIIFKTSCNRSEQEWIEEIEKRLEESVKKRLMSDVPYGT